MKLSATGESQPPSNVQVLLSLPGVGRIVTATLLSEAPHLIAERDYHGLQAHAGVAPVTRQSGKRAAVMIRRGCNIRRRNALFHWSRVSMQNDLRSREHYHRLRAKGRSHGRALRSLADRLLALFCAVLKSQTVFDPVTSPVTNELGQLSLSLSRLEATLKRTDASKKHLTKW